MKVTKFEDLKVWQASMKLASTLIEHYGSSKRYWIAHQILKSAVSVPSNIAEGYDRRTNKEFIQFLGIARGSCAELRTQLALDQASSKPYDGIESAIIESQEISAMITKLIQIRQQRF